MGYPEISREDWERVSDIGLRLINLSADEEDAEEYALVKSEMLAYLEELNRKYGPHPWIYDTIADNLPAGPAVLSWRLQAYELCDVDDLGEKIMIAQDICRYYLSHAPDRANAVFWNEKTLRFGAELEDESSIKDAMARKQEIAERFGSPDQEAKP